MSSTNKTTNYNLSQFLGSDKPAWLADYNQDMTKIDTQMKANSDLATGAEGKADANTTKIGDLDYLSTTVKTSLVGAINEVDGKAETAQNTANSAGTTATSAITKANAIESFLNINSFSNPSVTGNGINVTLNEIKCAVNSDGSLGKIYGSIFATVSSNSGNITIGDTGFRPSTNINVDGICFRQSLENSTLNILPITIHTDGTVTLQNNMTSYWNGKQISLLFNASLIIAKDFGD